jgi:hypothetical protein
VPYNDVWAMEDAAGSRPAKVAWLGDIRRYFWRLS